MLNRINSSKDLMFSSTKSWRKIGIHSSKQKTGSTKNWRLGWCYVVFLFQNGWPSCCNMFFSVRNDYDFRRDRGTTNTSCESGGALSNSEVLCCMAWASKRDACSMMDELDWWLISLFSGCPQVTTSFELWGQSPSSWNVINHWFVFGSVGTTSFPGEVVKYNLKTDQNELLSHQSCIPYRISTTCWGDSVISPNCCD